MKSIFIRILFIFFLTFICITTFSQTKIDVKIDDIDDSVLYLIKYRSDRSLCVIDSTIISHNKKMFVNDDNYEEGIYILADSRQSPLFEMLIGKDQKFSIHVEELMDLNSYIVKGSKETSDYFNVYSKTTHDNIHIKALENEIQYFPDNIRKIDSLKAQLFEYQESMLSKDKTSFLNTYIRFIEDRPINELPLCDERILNSRLLKNKLDEYFDDSNLTLTPEIICDIIDEFVSNANDCKKNRDYILWYLYAKYFNPEKIENESVYIHLADNYFSELEIENLTDDIRNEIIKRADILRHITLGQFSPTLIYIDKNGDTVNSHEIKSKYMVLFFHKPDCQKCIRDKRILGLVKNRRKDLEIIHIDISEENSDIIQDIISQYDIMTIPTIYVIDENKRIIAKHIKAEDIEFYLIKK